MAKIFIRERQKVGPGDKQPRFAVVGVQGTDMEFFQIHLRRGELDAIAQAIGAEIVELPRGKGEHIGEEGGGGKRGLRGKKRARRSTAA
jgi:hypothetical protein